jgi:heterodisulfide reductase subunit C2
MNAPEKGARRKFMSPSYHEKHAEKTFSEALGEVTGVKYFECYQCGKCSAGCPSAFEMDMLPHQVIHAVQMDQKDAVLAAKSLWACVGCQTCLSRCPNMIDIPTTMDTLRELAVVSGKSRGGKDVEAFHNSFLFWVEATGRVFEGGMVGMFKARTLRFFKDLEKAPNMFSKLKFLPERIKGHKAVARIFAKTRKG